MTRAKTRIARYGAWAALCLLMCSPAVGQKSPLVCEMELENASVLPGEPVILKYKFTNPGGNAIMPDFSLPTKEWLRVGVKNSEGKTIAGIPDNRMPFSEYNRGVSANAPLARGSELQGRIVLSQWIRTTSPGKYRVKVHVALPYFPPYKPHDSSSGDLAYSGDHELLLTVTQGSIRRLDRIAQEWLKMAWSKGPAPYTGKKLAIQALFSMPEDKAFPYWKEMVSRLNEYDSAEIDDQLQRLGTPTAKSLLATVVAYRARIIKRETPFSDQAGQ